MSENVTISQLEYESLRDAAKWADALDAAGVDNWEGYDVAVDSYNEEKSK